MAGSREDLAVSVLFDETARAVFSGRTGQKRVREFAGELSARVLKGRPFGCLVTGDAELRELNRRFRRKDAPTDVLSFPAGETRGYSGDIAISSERAAQQAGEHGHTLAEEIHILMLHGVLHLAGYDHERDAGEMERTESRLRKRFGLPAGLVERTVAK